MPLPPRLCFFPFIAFLLFSPQITHPFSDGFSGESSPTIVEKKNNTGSEASEPPPLFDQKTGYRLRSYFSLTPKTSDFATIINAKKLKSLLDSGEVFAVDVFDSGGFWDTDFEQWVIASPRFTVSGAFQMPGIGQGLLSRERQRYFRQGLKHLHSRFPLKNPVFFCKRNCWASWNAAKRASEEMNFRQIYWYPGGDEEWQELGYPLEKPELIDFNIQAE